MSQATLSRRQLVGTLGAGLAAAAIPSAVAQNQFRNMPQMPIKKFNVTVRRFDPLFPTHIDDFTLPVDCPDAEHAVSAVLSNLIAWTTKTEGSTPLSIAFRCMSVSERAG